MKALLLKGNGQIELAEVPVPKMSAGNVIVKMCAFTLNHLDLFSFRGMAFAKRQLPIIVGAEGAGIVVEVGAGVSPTWIGKHVAIYPALNCGVCAYCVAGRENLCDAEPKHIFGFNFDGLAAEYAVVPAQSLVEVPNELDWEHAACAPITFATVHHMLFDNAKLKEGESILVHAGGSGIGSTAIKMAKNIGATVYSTVGSEEKIEKAKQLGADAVINYREVNFAREIRKLTARKGVDVVFEHVGVDTFEGSMAALKMGGRLVTCGSTSGVETTINLFTLFNKQLRLFGSFGGSKRNMAESLRLMSERGISPVIDSRFHVDDYIIGLEKLRQRNVFGKIVFSF